jgi:hypothetical protein
MDGPGAKVPDQKLKAAEDACKDIREQIKPPNLSDEQREEFRKAALENARCMREHGIDFPDPQFGADGGVKIELDKGRVDPDSPKFKAAEKACRSTLPGGGPSTTDVRP